MDIVQQAAVDVVSQVMTGRNLNQALSEAINARHELSNQQRGALQDISYGTLRYYAQLSKILDLLLNKPTQDAHIRNLLLIAIYQLQYTKAAAHAIVDHAVNAIRKNNPAASGCAALVITSEFAPVAFPALPLPAAVIFISS